MNEKSTVSVNINDIAFMEKVGIKGCAKAAFIKKKLIMKASPNPIKMIDSFHQNKILWIIIALALRQLLIKKRAYISPSSANEK
jgi:hypothetical protein